MQVDGDLQETSSQADCRQILERLLKTGLLSALQAETCGRGRLSGWSVEFLRMWLYSVKGYIFWEI